MERGTDLYENCTIFKNMPENARFCPEILFVSLVKSLVLMYLHENRSFWPGRGDSFEFLVLSVELTATDAVKCRSDF